MSSLTRSLNRSLRSSVGVEITRARRPHVELKPEWFTRLLHFNHLVEQVTGVNGDLVECGVADGVGLASFASLFKAHDEVRQLWGFDSWEGLPAPSTADLGNKSIAAGGMFSRSSTKRVHDELIAYGLTPAEIAQNVTLVPGFFSDTLSKYDGRIAVLHIDADLYQSYLDCLEVLWPRVEVGGVVAFDEYGEPDVWPGAQRAVDEFFGPRSADVSELQHHEPSGKWWLTRRA